MTVNIDFTEELDMSQELLNNKELQALLSTLKEGETMEYEDQPLGKYGRMAMKYLHDTNPQRYSLLKMTGELMTTMYRIDEEATEMLIKIEDDYIKRNPLPSGDDFMAVVRAWNTARSVAEEFVLNDLIYC